MTALKTYEYGKRDAGITLIQPVDGREAAGLADEARMIGERTDRAFRLIGAEVNDWNRDLSPWQAPAVFGQEDFGDGAGETLRAILALCPDDGSLCCVGGYSLAALFALWAGYQTDRFAGAAAASPSVWFPGFIPYMRSHVMRCGAVSLSLGDREEKTRNPVLATVGDCIREGYDVLRAQRIRCTLEWNSGNHFRDAGLRTAKSFAWLINAL